mgnify:CR=1 FL=1
MERIKVAKAAEILGVNQQAVREQMKRGMIDIGTVIPKKRGKYPKQMYDYWIFRAKLESFIGRKLTDEELAE